MDKQSYKMVRQVLNALSHMPMIDKQSEQEILAEIARIKGGGIVKKKEDAEVAVKEEETLKSE